MWQKDATAMVDNASTSASESTPAHPRLTRHWLRWAAIAMALLLALILAAALLIAFMDWNKLRPWINEKVSTSTGRDFAINGDLQLQWTWPQPSIRAGATGCPAWWCMPAI
jgi:hypothetical protein